MIRFCFIWIFLWSLFLGLAVARFPPEHSSADGPALAPQSRHRARASPETVVSSSSGTAVPSEHHARHFNAEIIASLALASVAMAAFVLVFFGLWFYRRKNHQGSYSNGERDRDGVKLSTFGPIMSKFNSSKAVKKGSVCVIDHALLQAATNNFSESNVLSEGGSGYVYKACLDGGVLVTVKKMGNGRENFEREFENEMDLLCRLRHPNIVSLVGYSNDGQTRFLVYEFMQNGSLECQLHGPSSTPALTWHIRMKIALDTARGLEYLHEHCYPPVIHRDLRSSNVLLDSEFNAKISDFGLAVIGQSKSAVRLPGSLGHVAPEYLLDGKLTEKSDVYAFGVVLLELLMGRKAVEIISPSQCQSIVTWAMPQLTDRSKLPNIIDPVIRSTMDLKHLYQVAAVAVLCVQPEPSYRPLITDVLHSLIPLVPIELGGSLRIQETSPTSKNKSSVL
ncbi:putative receptor-like protein kinase At1g80640 [Wolffia australiana]